jgi:heme/copper-type cytochrome/quinol oxidase subunit 3
VHKYLQPSTGFGTVLFTLTGVHVTHTLTGVLTLGFVFFQIRNTTEIGDNQFAVEGAVKWWHFVDVAWVFIYPARYLLK